MISGKSFADRCQWVVDARYPDRPLFSYARARNGDWVFVQGDSIRAFLARMPLLRTKRFTLVVHNSDRTFGPAAASLLLPLAYRIYAVNCAVQHPRITPIPLGFVDRQLPLLPGFTGGSSERPIEVYMNFLDATNPEARQDCRNALRGDPRVTEVSGISVPEYYIDLGRSKFVLCPEGTGLDTHRIYESLLCGATPVVLHGPLDSMYASLPICIVSKWTDAFVQPDERKKIDWSTNSFL